MKYKGLPLTLLGALILTVILISCAPSIPHSVESRKECITCHGSNAAKPYPAWHASRGYTNDDCSSCHEPKTEDRNLAGATTK
jgi:hypothetical protein